MILLKKKTVKAQSRAVTIMQGLEGVAPVLRWGTDWHARPCSATPGGKETLEGPVTKDRIVNKRCSYFKRHLL
jgi:hypothetical protein